MKVYYRLLLIALTIFLSSQTYARVDVIHISTEDPSCFGANDGYVTIDSLTTTAPSGPYLIRINTSPVQFINIGDTIPLRDGNYTITIFDQGDGNAPNFRSFSINEPFQLVTIPISTDASCFGNCDGSATILAIDGTPPYTYQWSDPSSQTTPTASNLCAGKYFVTVTDNNSCTALDSATVSEPTQVVPNVTVDSVNCFGENSGSATANPSGGSGSNYTFEWSSSGNTTATENNLIADTYTITVTDGTGCTGVEVFTVNEPAAALTVSLDNKSDAFCFGEPTGFINIDVNGGTTPYTFAWDDGPTTEDRPNISAGTYTVTVTDLYNCTATLTESISEPTEITIDSTVTNVSCNGGADGEILLAVSGGVPGSTTFQWSNSAGNVNPNTGLSAGKYFVTVTNVVGCTVVDSAVVSEPTQLVVTENSSQDPTCNGGADGTIDIDVSGGTPTYSFEWGDLGPGSPEDRTNLSAGIYSVTVIDDNGCTEALSVTLNNPAPIIPNVTTSPALCKGDATGSATANPSGGSGNYVNYIWSSSGNNTDTENNLAAGTYTVTVFDDQGCTATETFSVSEPAVDLTASIDNKSDVFCFGETTGFATASGSGGTESNSYDFQWDDPSNQTTATANNLGAGTYNVTVTDDNGCTATTSVTIDSSPEITIDLDSVDVNCNGGNDGSVTANIGGGRPGYTYRWSNGPTGSGNSSTITGLTAGTYTITVTDNLFCTQEDSIVVNEPTELITLINSITNPLCNGNSDGSIDAGAIGGTPPYTYAWSDGVTTTEDISGLSANSYTLTVTDNNGCTATADTTLVDPALLTVAIDSTKNTDCNGESNGFLRALASGGTPPLTYNWSNVAGVNNNRANPNLPAGSYTVTVTDDNNCSATVTGTVTEPNVIVVEPTVIDASCAGVDDGSATATATGGTAPYTFNWSDGTLNNNSISGKAGGTFTVTVIDANGCTDDSTFTINQPNAISFSMDSTNLLCNNDNSGTASVVNPQGGTPPYTFNWDDPTNQTTQTATGLAASKFRVTVTDQNGCSQTDSVNLQEPTAITTNISGTDPSCSGLNDGEATVTANGGTVATVYTYQWDDPSNQTTATATGLTAGTYNVTVTDDNGCAVFDQITLTAPQSIIIAVDTVINVACKGDASGEIQLSISGGNAPYTYTWSDGPSTNQDRSGLVAQTYTVTVEDASGCSTSQSFNVTEPANDLTISTDSVSTLLCNGDNNGVIEITVAGSTAPYTYNWNDSDPNEDRNNLTAGNYSVTVTDTNGCIVTENFTITEPTPLGITIVNQDDASCNGASDGSATIAGNGGVNPYTFNWVGGLNGTSQSSLSAGTYTITITDGNSCTGLDSVIIDEPNSLLITLDTLKDVNCNGGLDGFITVDGSGGTAPYSFVWSNSDNNTGASSTTNNLTQGTYTVTLTDNNLCSATQTFTITEPSDLTLSLIATEEQCENANDGEITANAAGGITPYTFSWSNSGPNSPNLQNLSPGIYSATVTDANGCTEVATTFVDSANAIILNASATDALCNGEASGTLSASASGGAGSFSFRWSDGPTQPNRNNVAAGTYTISATDANSCTVTQTVTINEPSPIDPGLSVFNSSCGNVNDGSATSIPIGGTTPYTFEWSNSVQDFGVLTSSISNLASGSYDLTLTDANGCDTVIAFNVTSDAFNLTYQDSVSNNPCFGDSQGSIEIFNLSGGTAPYSYAWADVPTNTALRTNLAAGSYTVTISDQNGCDSVRTFTITEPNQLVANPSTFAESCNPGGDGEITFSPSGGTGAYTYNWSNGVNGNINSQDTLTAGAYTVTITDANACQIIENITLGVQGNLAISDTVRDVSCNGGNDGEISLFVTGVSGTASFNWSGTLPPVNPQTGLSAGTYDVTVTDQPSGCSQTASITVSEPAALNVTLNPTAESCSPGGDGAITATITGGTVSPPGDYNISWSNSASTANINGLTAGTYTITVIDDNGCSRVESATVTGGASNITLSETITDATCSGVCDGEINVSASGGTAPYTYAWDSGVPNGVPATNLCSGTYNVTVTDNAGCTQIGTYIVNDGANITLNTVVNNPDTCLAGVGSATVNASGGTQPYTYAWSNSTSSQTANNLVANDYEVTVTDNNGCSKIDTVTINNEASFTINLIVTDENCFYFNDGTITVQTSGGNNPLTYNWSGGLTGAFPTGVSSGTYFLTVTDATGCNQLDTAVINEPDPFVSTFTTVDESCSPGSDGSATISMSGGFPPYTYNWGSGQTNSTSISGLVAGSYRVTVIDSKGCASGHHTFQINKPSNFIVTETITDASCNGGSDGEIDLSVTGGVAPITFNWSNGLPSTEDQTGLTAGSYNVTVTDGTSCSEVLSYSITENSPIDIDITAYDESCSPGGDGSAKIVVTGGTTPYSYDWTSGITVIGDDSITNLTAGSYAVTITDGNSCTKVGTIGISSGSDIDANPSTIEPTCFGGGDGSITLNPTGSSNPNPVYTYQWAGSSNTSNTRNNLSSGVYRVTITDNNTPPCTKVENIILSQPNQISANIRTTLENCAPGNDGSAEVSFTAGGTSPYTYTWSAGTPNGDNVSDLSAGSYDVTVEDNNGCSRVFPFTINSAPSFTVSLTATDASCNGGNDGTINTTVSGATNPLTYDWSGGLPGGATPNTVSAGTYTVIVTDNYGCTATSSVTVNEPAPIISNLNTVDESCNNGGDGMAYVTPANGNAPYNIEWSNSATTDTIKNLTSGTYTVTITDNTPCSIIETFNISTGQNISVTETITNNGCIGDCDGAISLNVSGGQTPYTYVWNTTPPTNSSSISNQCSGNYTVTITDNANCSKVETYTINEPDPFSVTIATDFESCNPGNDGTATITSSSGGTAPLTFDWPGAVQGNSVNNLTAGNYILTITDDNGCSATEPFTINSAPTFTLSETVADVDCNGGNDGSINLNVSGEIGPMSYVWTSLPNGPNQPSLFAGTYDVTVTDQTTGCSETRSIVVNEPSSILVTANTNPETCLPGNDGSISLNVSGGTVSSNYTFNWNSGLPSQSTQTGLTAGTYSYTVTDDDGCSVIDQVVVGNSAPFTVSETITDVNCNGSANGEIALTVNGATGTPTFQWSNSLGNNDIVSNLVAGSYSVTVTDPVTGCRETQTYVVSEPDTITVTFSEVAESCSPGNDGSLTANPVGGTGNYTYQWSNSGTSQTISNLNAGTYTVTVSDANGCAVVYQGTVNNQAPFTLTASVDDLSCNASNDGRIELTVSGQSGNVSYNWNTLPAGNLQTNLAAGTYNVTVTDQGNGCSETRSFTLTEPTAITANLSSTPESCSPGFDGTASVNNPQGGTGQYTFNWSNNSGNATATGLTAGTYTVTITDANSCSLVDQVTVGSAASFTVTEIITDVNCNGGSDGSIDLTVSGSGGAPVFAWDNSLPPNDFQSGLSAGTYNVTITDPNNGCSETNSYTVNEPSPITANSTAVDASCGSCNGSASVVNPNGGTGTITVNWLDDTKTPIGQSGLTANNLCAGNYFAALEDANNCVDTILVQVSNTGVLPTNIFFQNESCLNACDGSVWVTGVCISSQDCSVTWRDLNGTVIGTNDTLFNLCPGMYLAEITDISTNCVTNMRTIVGSGAEITPNLTTKNNDCSVITLCSGYAKAEPTGGVAPYSFTWAGPSVTVNGTDSIGDLCAGNYSLTISDANNCDTIITFNISVGSTINPNETSTDETCFNACDGTINLNPTGGLTPYSYTWSSNAGVGNVPSANNLCTGVYRVTVADASQCDTVITINIGTNNAFTYTKSSTDLSCNGGCDGTASITVSGGSPGFIYNWDPTPANGAGTANVSGLCANKYFVTITDGSGCSAVDSVDIQPNSTIQPNEVVANESCATACDGSITLNPSGGIGGPYTYTWSPVPPNGQGGKNATNLCGGSYDVTIADGSGCDTSITINIQSATQLQASVAVVDQSCGGSSAVCDGEASVQTSGGTTPYTYNWSTGTVVGVDQDSIENVCAGGPYEVTVTDANGCSIVETFSIQAPTPITATFDTTSASCNNCDGSILATVNGPSPNLSFEWFDQSLTPLGNTTTSISNLCAGIYFLEVTDAASGCVERFSTSISNIGAETVTVNGVDASCANSCDGEATASFNCTNCLVEWFDASNGTSLGINTPTATNLCPGDYFVKVTNSASCETYNSITIDGPDQFNITENISNVTCASTCDGAISLNVGGGSGSNYNFVWSPAPGSGQGTASVTGLCSGNYSVTISDANSCDTVLSYTVGEPTALTASFTFIEATCGQADGFINATVSGGTINFDYLYQWFDGSNNLLAGEVAPSLNNVAAGTYILRATDDNGCEEFFTTVLGSSNAATITLDSISDNDCFGDRNGAISISVSGANTPFTYNWIPGGQGTEDITNLAAGTYTVEITNSLGCISTDTFTVDGPDELMASFNLLDANCGICDGEAAITMSGGIAPYSYLWSNGSTNDSADSLCGGTHSVEVTDANGCEKTFNFSINTSNGPTDAIVSATAASCASACDGTVDVQPIGGTAPYTYLWLHNGATTNSLNNLCAGNYNLQITDVSGCSRIVNINISSPSQLTVTESITPNSCNAFPCDGSIFLNVKGGAKPYSYNWDPAQNDSNYVDGLCAGIYNVTISDANGCSEVRSLNVPNTGVSITTNPTTVDVSCFGACDGSLISNLTPSADTSFRWFNNQGQAIAQADNDILNAVCAGDYILEITDGSSGCKAYYTATVSEPDSIDLAASIVNNISCNGSCDGEIFISATGGSLLYSYSWSDPENQQAVPARGLCADTYTVTATDANGCSEITSVTLTDPPALSINILSSTSLNCSSDCDASASVSANGGTAPYTFSWSGGQSGANPNDLCFGPNLITVEDATGCSLTDTVFIAATDTVVANVPSNTIICSGDSIYLDGTIIGSSVSSFAWYAADTTTIFTNSKDTTILRPVGNYTFFLIATNGSCADTTEYSPEVVSNPEVILNSSARLFKDEVLNISLGAQDQSYIYNWTPSTALSDSTVAEPIASPRENITYMLTVEDTNGCRYVDSIAVIYSPDIEIPSGFSPNGDGVNDVWNIELLEEFPNAKVQVFNRWGELLYEQDNGYSDPWDGTYEGKALPIGTYYYVIDLKTDRIDPMTGPITIVK